MIETFSEALPLIISGPSGSGKGTIINFLLKKYPDVFSLSCSYTTRNPREGEIHGKHYFFVTDEEFVKVLINFNIFF